MGSAMQKGETDINGFNWEAREWRKVIKKVKRHKEKDMFGRPKDYIRNRNVYVDRFCLFLGVQRWSANNDAE